MHNINTLILDLDGPLLEGRKRHYQCYSDILQEHDYTPIALEPYWEMKRNRVNRRELLKQSGAEELYNTFLKAWLERIETQKYLTLDEVQPGVTVLLAEWKKAGMRLLLSTMRTHQANLHRQLKIFGLLPYFDTVVMVKHEGEETKGSAVMRVTPPVDSTHAMWVGDTEVDIAAARELGIPVCALSCGLRTEGYLVSLAPDRVEEDLQDFARWFATLSP